MLEDGVDSERRNDVNGTMRELGIVDELHRQWFRIVMVDEFRTSSHCPDCTQAIKPFPQAKKSQTMEEA
jgi:hypothetical protein